LPNDDVIAVLGVWEGYKARHPERRRGSGPEEPDEVWVELERLPGAFVCSNCGRRCDKYHDVTERWVQDLPILDARTWLLVPRFRVSCSVCGSRVEHLPWLDKWARVTKRLAESVARLCEVMTVEQAAEFYGLGWDTVKAIHKAHLEAKLGALDLSGVEVVAMDEFAIQKGHRYATVVIEPYRKRVLWVGRGRGREDVRPFFELLGEDGRSRLRAVAMDMHAAYEEEVKAQCPQAEIVYDLFHVVAKYGREVIDRVRVDEANRLRENKKARKVIKGARWLLLRNRRNVRRREDRVRLAELLEANRALLTVYVLKDDLKHLWDYRRLGAARRFWQQWYARAIRSRVEPLRKFARNLKERIQGVLAHCLWPLHTSLLEGINNKIKVIKRMAYGFRDDDYFFLRIRGAFPGNTG
jgi:transposase